MVMMAMKTKRGPQRTVEWRQKHQHDRIQTNTYRQSKKKQKKQTGLVMVEAIQIQLYSNQSVNLRFAKCQIIEKIGFGE